MSCRSCCRRRGSSSLGDVSWGGERVGSRALQCVSRKTVLLSSALLCSFLELLRCWASSRFLIAHRQLKMATQGPRWYHMDIMQMMHSQFPQATTAVPGTSYCLAAKHRYAVPGSIVGATRARSFHASIVVGQLIMPLLLHGVSVPHEMVRAKNSNHNNQNITSTIYS